MLFTKQSNQMLFLRSDQATSTFEDGRYVFDLQNPIQAFKNHRILIEMLQFECPISFYLFDDTNNTSENLRKRAKSTSCATKWVWDSGPIMRVHVLRMCLARQEPAGTYPAYTGHGPDAWPDGYPG